MVGLAVGAGVIMVVEVVVIAVVVVIVLVAAVVVVVVDIIVFVLVVVVAVVVHTADDIDPEEPVNMLCFIAFDFTQETLQSVWSKDCAL